MDYDRHAIYVLPPAAVGAEGRVVIALRVWKSPDTECSVALEIVGQGELVRVAAPPVP